MLLKRIKHAILGRALNPLDHGMAHKMSLIAFFAWVGLGSDGLSSSCYGPEEAFLALRGHPHLSVFVALASAITVFVISASYSQIIELFPSGGGGYLVASKLISPRVGMIAGCALLIDYLLTITISVASGSDALFSFLPVYLHPFKLHFAVVMVSVLVILNLRGVKETVIPLVPVFLTFVLTHVFIIFYGLITQVANFPHMVESVQASIQTTRQEMGLWGMIFLILKAYSIGAGTYTGIEAISNGLPTLREPKVKTGKRTMTYMAISLAFTVVGLMLGYLFYNVQPEQGKTLNAVLFETISRDWGANGHIFVLTTLISEAMILFVAAQTGFIGGPRVLANMAVDRWFPTKFAALSDRLVTQKGILLMGIAALIMMIATHGSVKFLVVLYSINVFITFCLSQLGMVRYWLKMRKHIKSWLKRLVINGVGLLLTTVILFSVVILKFYEGGWITLVITGSLIALAMGIRRHYLNVLKELRRLSALVDSADLDIAAKSDQPQKEPVFDRKGKTAILMVNGYNGLGLHTLFNVIRLFGKEFKNFVFVQIGIIDAGNFKGSPEVEHLQVQAQKDIDRYVQFMRKQGYYAEGVTRVGIDVIGEIEKVGPELIQRFPGAVFFGGQLVFTQETIFTKWLHNYTVFAMQRKFYSQGIPFVVLPIKV
ncbi:MAG: amino acid transporter [Omnitrophica WOR_2 bacterium GWA2_47_8]|nr:MAG: amino acid transporter [Omnitrophica WOR_2 bacterium GWA2_47_8]